MSKEEKALVDVLEEILQYDPLTNESGFPCHMCGRRQAQGHYSKCPFVKARRALENWYKKQQSKESAVTPEQESAIREVAHLMYQISKDHGFHDGEVLVGPATDANEAATIKQHMGEWVANLHGEVSELWEAYRNRKLFLKCDKACDLTCAEEELADIMIRCMDTATALGIDLGKAIHNKSEYNRNRAYRHGGKLVVESWPK